MVVNFLCIPQFGWTITVMLTKPPTNFISVSSPWPPKGVTPLVALSWLLNQVGLPWPTKPESLVENLVQGGKYLPKNHPKKVIQFTKLKVLDPRTTPGIARDSSAMPEQRHLARRYKLRKDISNQPVVVSSPINHEHIWDTTKYPMVLLTDQEELTCRFGWPKRWVWLWLDLHIWLRLIFNRE